MTVVPDAQQIPTNAVDIVPDTTPAANAAEKEITSVEDIAKKSSLQYKENVEDGNQDCSSIPEEGKLELGISNNEGCEEETHEQQSAQSISTRKNKVRPDELSGFPLYDAVDCAAQMIDSGLPEKCKHGVPCCLGIDEAGRGPVLGPMLYGAAYWPLSESEAIEKLGYDDSKALSEGKREALFEGIKSESDRIGYVLCNLSAEHISTRMLGRSRVSLNAMSHKAAIDMIHRAYSLGANITEIYVDTVGNPETYQKRLEQLFGNRAKVVVTAKADSLYKVVSAASICAKVTRDSMIKQWYFPEEGRGCKVAKCDGSGYPSDPRTKVWLQGNSQQVFGFPNFVRFSWQTCATLCGDTAPDAQKAMANLNKVTGEGSDHEDVINDTDFVAMGKRIVRVVWEEDNGGNQSITSFFGANRNNRAPYYNTLQLKSSKGLIR